GGSRFGYAHCDTLTMTLLLKSTNLFFLLILRGYAKTAIENEWGD
ncbi:MAG: hypothetical protein JWO06_3936, partial [Bacteroidota bacterium]|nr:hypothetical protein [Bacteroidota bacterium]